MNASHHTHPRRASRLSTEQKTRILSLWKDPTVGLTGLTRFQTKLAERGMRVPLTNLKQLLAHRDDHALFSGRPARHAWNTITETGVGKGWQIDLLDMSVLGTRNKNLNWILTVIDVYSRYAFAVGIKNKGQHAVSTAFETVLRQSKHAPLRITHDAGKEFLNAKMNALLKKHNLERHVNQANDKTKTGIIERWNRTLRELLGRNFSRIGRLRWVEDLQSLVDNYNASVHSTLGTTPKKVWLGQATPKPRTIHRESFSLLPGQHVRTRLFHKTFDKKAGAQTWSKQIYQVVQRLGFKYVVRHLHGPELKTKYRPSDLKLVPEEVVKTMQTDQATQHARSLEKQQEVARAKKSTRRFLKKQDLLPASRHGRLRRTTLRQRLRQHRA